MKIVIDITEAYYSYLKELNDDVSYLVKKVKNGTPLPKGHGRLIDGDELIRNDGYYNPVKYTDEFGDVITVADIVAMPTIIEADKE